ncbi:MAG: M20/M25/M40 family metallo-hydrolase [Synergistaceae bacterium]|jgi:acetylornithine deacetylase|nr:M20/M25/M40 family metallo-hydrolase [Synergistaceae bacterium]
MSADSLIELLSELIRIDSSNVFLNPGSPGEKEAQLYMQRRLNNLGISAALETIEDGYANLTACLKGEGGGRDITLYAHADTVGYAAWKDTALKPRVEGNRLYGLGSADDKGHCASILLAAERIVRDGFKLKGDVHLCFVCDEEGRSKGAMDYVKRHPPTPIIVLEPAPIHHITTTHQGFGWLDIRVKGRAAHGSAPEYGIDAVSRMGEILVRLERLKNDVFKKTVHPMNGETVYHASVIAGGSDYGTYPDSCALGIEIGTQPGETIQNRIDDINAIFGDVKKIYPDLDARVDINIAREPFLARGHEEIFELYADNVRRVTGKTPEEKGANMWTDAQLFQDGGFPTIMTGAGGAHFHAADEWVSLTELRQLTDILVNTVKTYCG